MMSNKRRCSLRNKRGGSSPLSLSQQLYDCKKRLRDLPVASLTCQRPESGIHFCRTPARPLNAAVASPRSSTTTERCAGTPSVSKWEPAISSLHQGRGERRGMSNVQASASCRPNGRGRSAGKRSHSGSESRKASKRRTLELPPFMRFENSMPTASLSLGNRR